jgi:HK97 family phage prohead protease
MEYKSLEFKAESVNIGARTFEGYASTWDIDQTNDIIHQGAFTKTIKEGMPANKIKVLWQHDQPLGLPLEMHEDSTGLYVKGYVSKTSLGDDALTLMSDKVVNRMSIGFSIPQNKSNYDDQGVRNIFETKLFEFSPVTFPANENAFIKSMATFNEQAMIAKTKGLHVTDSNELKHLLDSLKALMQTDEPLINTHNEAKPLIDECTMALKSLGDFAKTITFK